MNIGLAKRIHSLNKPLVEEEEVKDKKILKEEGIAIELEGEPIEDEVEDEVEDEEYSEEEPVEDIATDSKAEFIEAVKQKMAELQDIIDEYEGGARAEDIEEPEAEEEIPEEEPEEIE